MSEIVSIVVVNCNTRGLLGECLRSVEAHGEGAETIVVDNGSSDGSVGMVREEFPWVRVMVNERNEGYAKANNQGIRASEGRYVLLLNSDARLTVGALGEMVQCMEEDERAGICGPRLVYPDGGEQFSWGELPSLWGEVRSVWGGKEEGRRMKDEEGLLRFAPTLRSGQVPTLRSGQARNDREVGMVSGASMMLRWKMLDEVGMLDERFFMFSEEVDLCKRAQAGGWKVRYVAEATVVHVGGGSTGQTAGRVLNLYRGKLQYFEKHGKKWERGALWMAMRGAAWVKRTMYKGKGVEERAVLWEEVGRGMKELRGSH